MRTFAPLLFVAALALPACGHAMAPDEAVAALHDPSAKVRQHAADSLRAGGVVPTAAIPILLGSLQTEADPAVRGAILITLGQSGAPEAKPAIDQGIATAPDVNARRWAGRALKSWLIQTGAMPQGTKTPPQWPYGQPGFPPAI